MFLRHAFARTMVIYYGESGTSEQIPVDVRPGAGIVIGRNESKVRRNTIVRMFTKEVNLNFSQNSYCFLLIKSASASIRTSAVTAAIFGLEIIANFYCIKCFYNCMWFLFLNCIVKNNLILKTLSLSELFIIYSSVP